MRIAAGVLLILAGVFNGCAGTGYAFGGAAGAAVVEAGDAIGKAAIEEAAKTGDADTKAAAEAMAKANEGADKAKAAAGGMMLFGLFLLVMLGLQIAGGVVLFMSKAAKFVTVVGGLGILAELGGVVAFSVPFGLTNTIGVVGSILAILAAKGYAGGGDAPAAPAAPAAEG